MEEYTLRTYELTKCFGGKIAVNHLSMNIKKGDVYGFIGPNGAGKTTAMKVTDFIIFSARISSVRS